jgi:hypothetical protein
MPLQIVNADTAVAIRRAPGTTVTLINNSATDVYIDTNPNRLNATLQGVVPSGTKLAATGGQIQIASFFNSGVVYARAVSQTTIEVQP